MSYCRKIKNAVINTVASEMCKINGPNPYEVEKY